MSISLQEKCPNALPAVSAITKLNKASPPIILTALVMEDTWDWNRKSELFANLSSFDSNGSAGSPVLSTILLDGIKYWEVTFTNFGSYPFPAIVVADNVVMQNTTWFRQNGFHYHGGLATKNIYNFSTTGVDSNLGQAALNDTISYCSFKPYIDSFLTNTVLECKCVN